MKNKLEGNFDEPQCEEIYLEEQLEKYRLGGKHLGNTISEYLPKVKLKIKHTRHLKGKR